MDNVTERPRSAGRRTTVGVAVGWALAVITATANVLTALGILVGLAAAGPIENPETSIAGYTMFTLVKFAIAGVALGLGYISMRLTREERLPLAVTLWAVLAAMAAASTVTPATLLWLPTL